MDLGIQVTRLGHNAHGLAILQLDCFLHVTTLYCMFVEMEFAQRLPVHYTSRYAQGLDMQSKNEKSLHMIAQRQGGYFDARQATQAGFSHNLQSYHCRSGHWLRLERALFRLPGYCDTIESEFARWSLWAGSKSRTGTIAISHESALQYYGVLPYSSGPVHLTISAARRDYHHPSCCIDWAMLEPDDYVTRPGFLITTPRRTLLDLKPDLMYRCQWATTLENARKQNLISAEECAALSERPAATATYVNADATGKKDDRMPDAGRKNQGRELAAEFLTRGRFRGTDKWLGAPRHSFTLVEMLVVITVILLLASLLMPALSSALDSASSLSCANNLKQTGFGYQMYATDNGGRIPKNNVTLGYNPNDVNMGAARYVDVQANWWIHPKIAVCPKVLSLWRRDFNKVWNGTSGEYFIQPSYWPNASAFKNTTKIENIYTGNNGIRRGSSVTPMLGELDVLWAQTSPQNIYLWDNTPDRIGWIHPQGLASNVFFFDGHTGKIPNDSYFSSRWLGMRP